MNLSKLFALIAFGLGLALLPVNCGGTAPEVQYGTMVHGRMTLVLDWEMANSCMLTLNEWVNEGRVAKNKWTWPDLLREVPCLTDLDETALVGVIRDLVTQPYPQLTIIGSKNDPSSGVVYQYVYDHAPQAYRNINVVQQDNIPSGHVTLILNPG